MPKNLKRHNGQDDLHFITFSCRHRLPLLGSAHARDIFVLNLGKVRQYYSFLLVGFVVMPEHVHLLMSETPQYPPSSVLQVLKHHVANDLKGLTQRTGHFWDPRFYDFNVYTANRRVQKLDYMHMNPWKRGLVRHPAEWRWSSFLNYQIGKTGLITIDYV